jgi:hypothetical protein
MGCKKATVKFAKRTWKILGPVLVPHVSAGIQLVEQLSKEMPGMIAGGHNKRKAVIDEALRKAKEIGHDAFDDAKEVSVGELESAVRVFIERQLALVRKEGIDWMETIDVADENEPVNV